ncbi:MAG: hypothetical protein KDD45_10910 [Bdellovibrionales bacterium]|nr:hypothetical protein [Bdellovibrionales bacterium]
MHKLIFICFSFVLFGFSQATELQAHTGFLGYSGLNGCCESNSPTLGFGALVRTKVDKFGLIDFAGFSNKNWSEFLLLRPLYLNGSFDSQDPGFDMDIRVSRLEKWQFVLSYGLGYFIHNGTTVSHSLPVRVTGLTFTTQTQLRYTLDSSISFIALGELGAATAIDEKGVVWGGFFGINYRPSK